MVIRIQIPESLNSSVQFDFIIKFIKFPFENKLKHLPSTIFGQDSTKYVTFGVNCPYTVIWTQIPESRNSLVQFDFIIEIIKLALQNGRLSQLPSKIFGQDSTKYVLLG